MKEKRFELPLDSYPGELDIVEDGKNSKCPITDKKLLLLCLELQRADSISDLRRVNDLCALIEASEKTLLVTDDQKKFLTRRIETMGWNPKREIRVPVLALVAKFEMAKEVEVEVNKA